MIYIIYPDVDLWNYVLKELPGFAIARPLNRYCNKLQLVARKTLPRLHHISQLIIGHQMRQELSQLTDKDVLLVCDYTNLNLLIAIKECVIPNVKTFLWIWNPIKGIFRDKFVREVNLIKSLGYIITTFDPQDAKDFDLLLKNQFFRMKQEKIVTQECYDFYFLGFAKDREQEINRIKSLLNNYRQKFIVVHHVSEAITYEENIANTIKSKCLVEIVQHNQSGLTLRPLEAMAFGKKLLTNNLNIKNEDFYNKSNIFILGENDFRDLDNFLSSPFVSSVIDNDKYDVVNWLKSFC